MVDALEGSQENRNILRLRGLPYSASDEDIHNFFGPSVNITDVHIVHNMDGKASGDAYVQFLSEEDLKEALKKDQESMGRRYIEVFTIGDVETNQVLRRMRQRAAASKQGTIRVRGLPFSCTAEELKDFFKGMNVVEIVFGREPGGGRLTGEAYIRFDSKGDAERASGLSGQYLGKRYLEIFNVDGNAFENFKEAMNSDGLAMMQNQQRHGPPPLSAMRGDSWNSYGPPAQQQQRRTNQYPSYQDPVGGYGGAYNDPYTPPYNRSNPSVNRPPLSSGPPPRNGNNYGYSTTGNYSGGYDARGAAGGYGAPQGGYGVPPHSYSGYQGGGYGAPLQQPYSQENYPGNDKSCQYRGAGRCIGGEILNAYKVHMRGLPYRVTAKEIESFFFPLQIVEIKTGVLEDGRASGDGIVEFNSEEDALEALTRDKKSIKNRYIELFSHDNAKISSRTSYRSVMSRASGGYNVRVQSDQPKPLFAPW